MTERADDGEDRAFTVQLEVDLERRPICGRLRTRQGAEERFVGWLGFAEALKRLHEAHRQERNDHDERRK